MENEERRFKLKKKKQNEQLSITIASTDAKKHPMHLHISNRKLKVAAGAMVLAVMLAVSFAAAALVRVSEMPAQTGTQPQLAQASLAAVSDVTAQPSQSASVQPEENPLPSAERKPDLALKLLPEYETQISQSLIEMRQAQDTANTTMQTAAAPGSITISAAIEQIIARFNEQINAKIEAVKVNAQFDEFQTEYAGDIEGDSDTVNNWADVLAVYAVATGTELRGLTAIPEANIELLNSIYDSMNIVEVTAKTTAQKSPATSKEEAMPVTTLTACLNVESLTYEDGADLQEFTNEQKQALEQLMSPDYYAVFAQLLGIDYYDGLDADKLTAILSNLDEGTTGAAIVQAALTRLGNPYSKGRRGSGRYVDCSYFAYWAYDQAGVVIPTSSVEQARYCYNNGCKVKLDDLQPGDLIFWSRNCNCGRWREIHHSGIYIGDNKVIEASSSRGRVVIRELWEGGGWRIYMGARPYAH